MAVRRFEVYLVGDFFLFFVCRRGLEFLEQVLDLLVVFLQQIDGSGLVVALTSFATSLICFLMFSSDIRK